MVPKMRRVMQGSAVRSLDGSVNSEAANCSKLSRYAESRQELAQPHRRALRFRLAACAARSRARRCARIAASDRCRARRSPPCSIAWRTSARCCRRAVLHRVDQRQRRLAFAQVVAEVLADLARGRPSSRARRRSAGTRCRGACRRRRSASSSSRLGAGRGSRPAGSRLEQLRRLVADHPQIALLVDVAGRGSSSAAALRPRRSRWSRRRAPRMHAHVARRPTIIWNARE